MKKGFTLVEMVVTVTLATVVFGGAFMIYNFSNRSRGVTATARALQTALLIQEQLVTDMGHLVQPAAAPLQVRDKQRLSFYAYDPRISAGRAMKVRGVVYNLEKKKGALMTRACGDAVEQLGTSPLTAAEFTPFECATGPFLRVTLTVGREDGEPEAPDTVHSFLVPVNLTGGGGLQFPVETKFKDEADEPENQEFPDR